jgi:calcium-dependent protein kinase
MGCVPSVMRKKDLLKSENSKKVIKAKEDLNIKAKIFIRPIRSSIYTNYEIGKKLGSGTYGYVRLATHVATGQMRAIKTIKKSKIYNENSQVKFFDEVDILIKTNHPNIIRLFEFYEDENNFNIVTEYLSGGELLDVVVRNNTSTEQMVAQIMKQIFSGVAYCHSKNIVHRDLKPQNILFNEKNPNGNIKLIDFGASIIMKPKSKIKSKQGTILFIAPEVIEGNYDEKCDIWSCGVILYLLLSRSPPFYGRTKRDILQKICNKVYDLESPIWDEVSESGKEFIKKCLEANPKKRFSAKEALKDKWIIENTLSQDRPTAKNLTSFNNLFRFRAEMKLQKVILSFISHQYISKEEMDKLTKTFKELDKNEDGKLSKEEIIEGMSLNIENKNSVLEIDRIMSHADIDNSGYIDYSEFLMASSKLEGNLNQRNIDAAFSAFDADGDGKISAEELREMLGNGVEASASVWKELIEEFDQDYDGQIDYKEFKDMMLKLLDQNNK